MQSNSINRARLQGKVAFITGAGSGIGAATAVRLAAEGAKVMICGRNQQPLDLVVEQIKQDGGVAQAVIADVSNEFELVSAIERCACEYGSLDIMVNNAMAFTWGSIEEMDTPSWHANFKTSVDGTFWGTKAAMKLMKQNGGSIINLSSICGELGTAWMSGYSAAKAAVTNFSRAAAAEGAASRIRVNTVIPAVVETPATEGMLSDPATRKSTERLIPMGRVGQPDELASVIAFLASDDASYVTGVSLPVDGGRSAVLVTALD
ncbi:short-chain dehydrogenase/reductase SDR [Shewanella halifaxensis HAW-EB4]|uniref:Short-chain dehydrogenase/reductase SDR n=1 Tax=Shewanella halifaxensis (strain HAW-EB4) TaxID=458817 RepID=B0TTU4_SHEHH|nr:SDR family NAD(P)-dependent oxidoreductase [Shewanella halifaxensis]ABZ76662.1 short-chain dehydrogenase/reductase SDR [Shewanella halifaxensis HAW-EB4]